MALSKEQLERFEANQRMRDEIFKLVQYEIEDIFDYLKIVDGYDHCGTPDEYLERESTHLKTVIENLSKGRPEAGMGMTGTIELKVTV